MILILIKRAVSQTCLRLGGDVVMLERLSSDGYFANDDGNTCLLLVAEWNRIIFVVKDRQRVF